MAINPLGMNEGTQEFIRFEDDGGTINTQIIDVRQGTITLSNPTGTTVTVDHGTITLSNPTGTTVQFNNGTVNLLHAGTITRLIDGTVRIPAGTITSVTDVANLAKGTITRVEQGSIAVTAGTITNLLKAEDAAHSSGDSGVMMLGVRQDSQVDFGADGDYVPFSIDENGNVRTTAQFSGTLESTVGTIAEVTSLSGGTITRLEGGTLGLVTRVGNVGTLEVGTISALPNTPGGTLGLVTTVSNLTNGSVRMTVGTLTVMPNIPGGTVGLVTTVSNLSAGSVAVVAGTVSAGTINIGTVQLNPYPSVNIITAGTTSAGTIGTIVAAPAAGTQVVVTGFHILGLSGTAETVVSFGLQAAGNQVIARGNFPAGAGITEQHSYPSAYGATGTALTWNMLSGSGTVSYKVNYYLR